MVKYAFVAAALAGLAVARPSDLSGRGKLIVGGEKAGAGEFPFIVSLQERGSHFCGGTLINARTVVTAGHCTTANSQVRFGTMQWAMGGHVVNVSEIIVHPKFDMETLKNDIAIWKLAEDVPEGNGTSFAKLPAAGSDPASGSDVVVAGWGATQESNNTLPQDLMKVTVPVLGRTECLKEYAPIYGNESITDGMFCAGIEQGGKDSCQGDSGGPMVDSTNVLVGVVSWGRGCAQAGYAGVYTRVSSYLDFIKAHA